MEQGTSSGASRGATEHHPHLRHPSFLDLPLAALRSIASTLDIDDRKSLALSCKPLCNAVRQLWSTLIVNIYGGYDDPVPLGLSSFSGVRTIIWTEGPVAEYDPAEHGDWDSKHLGYLAPNIADWEVPNPDAIARLTVVNELLYRAINPEGTTDPRLICLKIEVKTRISGIDLYAMLMQTMPPSFPLRLPLSSPEMDQNVREIAQESAELIAQGMAEFGSGFWRLQVEQQSQSVTMNDLVQGWANAPYKHIMAADVYTTDLDQDIFEALEQQNAVLSQSGLQDARAMQGGLPKKWAEVERKRYGTNMGNLLTLAYAIKMPYSEVWAGWFTPSGMLGYLVSRCSVDWCCHSPPARINFEPYAGKLRDLRFRVNRCEEDQRTAEVFHRHICPQINTLTSLQKLYLGRSISFDCLPLDPRALQLPSLTRLVLNEYIDFEHFEHFTHLTALESLSFTMPDMEYFGQHPQDLSALKTLPNLISLTIENWCVQTAQDVACLTKLTELSLTNLDGPRLSALDASVPMLHLVDFAITRTLSPIYVLPEDASAFTERWAENAARLFPNVEVLQLGPWGQADIKFNTLKELKDYAVVVDRLADIAALSKAHKLRYFQLDCILNFASKKLEKRCEAGATTLTNMLDVALLTGEAGGNASSASSAIDQGNRREVRRWERSVVFEIREDIDGLVAEFHYCLV